MKSFNILLNNFNTKKSEAFDIMPFLIRKYKDMKEKNFWWILDNTENEPKTREDFKKFIDNLCKFQYWSRCEYEFIMLSWPYGNTDTLEECKKVLDTSEKIDGYEQIKMNLEVVVDVFIENIKEFN